MDFLAVDDREGDAGSTVQLIFPAQGAGVLFDIVLGKGMLLVLRKVIWNGAMCKLKFHIVPLSGIASLMRPNKPVFVSVPGWQGFWGEERESGLERERL